MASPAGFMSLGLPAPKKSFLDGANATAGGSAGSARAPHQPHSARPDGRPPSGAHGGHSGGTGGVDTKAVILNEHKTELIDMLHESVSMLKNVYRSKFVFGDHLRYVDPSYGGDTVNQFNLATPPSFDASYVPPPMNPVGGAQAGQQQQQGAGGETAGDAELREKKRVGEELIKKLYRRNTQLETENKYCRGELTRLERFQGLGRTTSHNSSISDGHLPLDHPLYTRKNRRNCRSCPPTRTLVRAVVNGSGLAFPPRGGVREEPVQKEDPLPVAQLKQRVIQLTEALVAVQHENEKLAKEKIERVSLRDTLLRNYIVDRDTQITGLHRSLQDLINKVANPMKLTRAKQPASSINPVVATNNVLKDISQRLSEQIGSITTEIVRKAATSMPPSGTSYEGIRKGATTNEPTILQSPSKGGVDGNGSVLPDGDANAGAAGAGGMSLSRRKELSRRLKAVVDTLPIQKRKQMVLLLTELKQLFESLSQSNHSLLATYEAHKVKSDQDIVQLKLEVAMLRDELRAVDTTGGGFGGNATQQGGYQPEDP